MTDEKIKISQFIDGGNLIPGDKITGLRGGVNALFEALTNAIPSLIFASPNGSASNVGDGSYLRPYTAAYAETKAIIGHSSIFYMPGAHVGNIAFKPSIGRIGLDPRISVLSGNITIDGTWWDATENPHLDLDGVGFTGTVNFVGSAGRYGTDRVTFKNCLLPDSIAEVINANFTYIGNLELLNGTQVNGLSITAPGRINFQSPNITGTVKFIEGLSGIGVPFILNGLGIDTLSADYTFDTNLMTFKITNCDLLGTDAGGEIIINEESGAGYPFTFIFDAVSYCNNVTKITGYETVDLQRLQNEATSAVDGSITNAMLAGSIAQSKITNLTGDLAAKAPIASPTFTGTVRTTSNILDDGSGNATIDADLEVNDIKANNIAANLVRVNGLASSTIVVEKNIISSPYTGASVTLDESALLGKVIACNPTLAQEAKLPTAADFDAAFAPLWPNSVVPVYGCLEFTVENVSTTALAATTITVNTGMSIITENAVPVVAISSCKRFKLIKASAATIEAPEALAYQLWGGG